MNLWPMLENTEPSRRKAEGVETMHPPTLRGRADEIVRSAWRHAESGGNDLTLLGRDVHFCVPQSLGDLQAANLLRRGVSLPEFTARGEKVTQEPNLFSLASGQDSTTQDVEHPADVFALDHGPLKHRFLTRPWADERVVKVSAEVALKLAENLGIVVADADADLGPQEHKGLALVGHDSDEPLTPEESAELGFPQFALVHTAPPRLHHTLWNMRCQEATSRDTMYDLQSDSNITNVWVNAGAPNKSDYFAPSFKDIPLGIRLYESTLAPITRASGYGDVYQTVVLGAEAYGTVKVSTLPAKIIVHPPGSSGASDPLDQVGTVGFKANFASVILNQSNLVNIYHQTSVFTGTRAGL